MVQLTTIIKLALMGTFFLEVTIFGRFISKMNCFKNSSIMETAMTFSGGLFLSIAMIDIIPQAISSFTLYFCTDMRLVESSSSLKSNLYLPLTMIIAMTTFMIIMYIDKILIGHSHDHEYEVSFIQEPKKSDKQMSIEIKRKSVDDIPNLNEPGVAENVDPLSQQIGNGSANDKGMNNELDSPVKDCESNKQSVQENVELTGEHSQEQFNWKPFILQIGMSIHAFFECLAVGLQRTPIGVLSLASAILVHKWAQGLTLGLMYRKEGFKQSIVNVMIIVQGLINVFGLLTGTILIDQGMFVMAFFMSISAGTFFYISLVEVLNEQLKLMSKSKIVALLTAIFFIAFIVWFEKHEEEIAEQSK